MARQRQITEKELDELDDLVQAEDIAITHKMEYLNRLKDTDIRNQLACNHLFNQPAPEAKKWLTHDYVSAAMIVVQALFIAASTWLASYFVTHKEFSEYKQKQAIEMFELRGFTEINRNKLNDRTEIIDFLTESVHDLDKRVYFMENNNESGNPPTKSR